MADYPVTSVPMFVNKGKPKGEFSWRERNIERRARRERMAQYEVEKVERERITAEEAAQAAAAKTNEEIFARIRNGSDAGSSSASSNGYEVGDLGSPSPAAKARSDKKAKDYAVFDRLGVTDEQLVGWRARLDAKVRAHDEERKNHPKPDEDPNDPYVIRRKKLEAEDAMIKKIAANTTPMFMKPTTDVTFLHAAEEARETERKSKGLPEPPKTEAELDPTWGSRRRGHPEWVQKILHPEQFEQEEGLGDENILDKQRDTVLPTVEVSSITTSFLQDTAQDSAPHEHRRIGTLTSANQRNAASTFSDNADHRTDIVVRSSAVSEPLKKASESVANKDFDSLWNGELEFTEQSIEVSMSPQLKIRRFDTMKEQEIDAESARRIASTQLERIRERNSEERAFSPDAETNKSNENPSKGRQDLLTPETVDFDSKVSKETQFRYSLHDDKDEVDKLSNNLEEQGMQIPNTPITIYNARTYHKKYPSKSEEELRRIREDSYDALRELSRSFSRSPEHPILQPNEHDGNKASTETGLAPIPTDMWEKTKHEKAAIDITKSTSETKAEDNNLSARLSARDALRPDDNQLSHSRPTSLTRSDIDPEERIAAEAKLFELQDNMSVKNSTHAPSPTPSDEEYEIVEETPKPKKQDPLTMPTPRIVGAFIETPAPAQKNTPLGDNAGVGSRHVKLESTADNDDRNPLPAPRPRPPLINTAKKFSVADDIKRLKMEAGIDDSMDDFDSFVGRPTIADPIEKFEDVDEELAPVSPVDELISKIIKDRSTFERDIAGRTLSARERDRRLEEVIMERLSKHLSKTTSSLRDTRHGIERIEKQVQTTITKRSSQAQAVEHTQLRVKIAEVSKDDTVYIKIPVPRLWRYEKKKDGEQKFFSRNWKFTWLGLVLTLFVTWFFAETVACDIYCHPLYASKNTWHPDDPFFPYAIPTKLDQWTGKYASNAMYSGLEWIDDMRTGQKLRGTRFRGGARPPRPTRTVLGAEKWRKGKKGQKVAKDHEATRTTQSMFADEVLE